MVEDVKSASVVSPADEEALDETPMRYVRPDDDRLEYSDVVKAIGHPYHLMLEFMQSFPIDDDDSKDEPVIVVRQISRVALPWPTASEAFAVLGRYLALNALKSNNAEHLNEAFRAMFSDLSEKRRDVILQAISLASERREQDDSSKDAKV